MTLTIWVIAVIVALLLTLVIMGFLWGENRTAIAMAITMAGIIIVGTILVVALGRAIVSIFDAIPLECVVLGLLVGGSIAFITWLIWQRPPALHAK